MPLSVRKSDILPLLYTVPTFQGFSIFMHYFKMKENVSIEKQA